MTSEYVDWLNWNTIQCIDYPFLVFGCTQCYKIWENWSLLYSLSNKYSIWQSVLKTKIWWNMVIFNNNSLTFCKIRYISYEMLSNRKKINKFHILTMSISNFISFFNWLRITPWGIASEKIPGIATVLWKYWLHHHAWCIL